MNRGTKLYNTGWLQSPIDNRDILVCAAPARKHSDSYMVPNIDNVPVLNQMSRGSCVGHAAAVVKTWQELKERQVTIPYSREYIYDKCKTIDGIPDQEGTYPRIAMKVLQKFGACQESLCPYQEKDNQIVLTSAMDRDALQGRITRYGRVQSINALKSALVDHGPVLIGVPIYNSFFSASNGVIPMPSGDSVGGHALTIIGWEPGYYIFRNSWSESWGNKGNGKLPEEYPELISDAWLSVDMIGLRFTWLEGKV